MFRILAGVLAAAAGFAAAGACAAMEVDSVLSDYTAQAGLSGGLKAVGSNTLTRIMVRWAADFGRQYPGVKIAVEGQGSGTAPPALTAGTAELAPMSRPMNAGEIAAFEKTRGYKPTPVRVAVDALALYVNAGNPVACLSFAQIDAIFSKSHKRGAADIARWGQAASGQVGVTGTLGGAAITLYGRDNASGTGAYLKDLVLQDGEYKDSVKVEAESADVVRAVSADKAGIGYAGVGYGAPGARSVPVAAKDGGHCFAASADNAYSGDYPMARFLYVYLNIKPGAKLAPLSAEFVKYMLSKQGQAAVIKDGFFPLPAAVALQDLKTVGLQ